MRALLRHALTPLIVSAALLGAAATPAHLSTAAQAATTVAQHIKVSPQDCPVGTSWDNGTHTCV